MIKRIVQTVAMAVFFLSIMAADSDSWIPLLTLLASGAWLAFTAWLTGWFHEPEEEEE